MDQKISNSKLALSSASALLAAQWVIALVSIPSAQDYANQLADGVKPENVVTLYDNLSLLITITLAWSWITTNRFLLPLYEEEYAANKDAMRLKRGWVVWGWIVPIVSFWFPKRIVDDLISAKYARTNQPNPIGKISGTWWATWISFVLINNLVAINVISASADPIQPAYEIAAACMLTASYTIWTRILKVLA